MLQVIAQASPAVAPITQVIFVDLNASGVGSDGSIGKPYQTIQAAIDSIPTPPIGVNLLTSRKVHTIMIAPGAYDEDLAIDLTRKRIILSGFGPWGLGTFNTTDWQPTAPRRNIIITSDGTGVNDNIRDGFSIQPMLPAGEGLTTHESYFTRPRISGHIDVSGYSGPSLELTLSCEIFGTTGSSAGDSIIGGLTIVQSYIYHSRFRGKITGINNWNFQVAERSRFGGLVSVGIYSTILSCKFDNGFTVGSAALGGIQPEGFIATDLRGTFTGPASSLRLDPSTNYWFVAAGNLLAGGATKVFLYDLTP